MLINKSIPVDIQGIQRRKAMRRPASIWKKSLIPEQLGTAINASISIEIPNQQSIRRSYPTGTFCEAIAIVIEVNPMGGLRKGRNTIPIEIKDQWGGVKPFTAGKIPLHCIATSFP